MKDGLSQNFGLTQAEFAQMAADLRDGHGQLFERIFLAQFRECSTYLEKKFGASKEDAEDATMETLLHFRILIIQDKLRYQNLRFIFTRMAAQWYFRQQKKQPPFEVLNGIELRPIPEVFDHESFQSLDLAWDQLGENCQQLLKEYYYHGKSTLEISAQLNQTDASVRQKKKRCIDKLRTLFFPISEKTSEQPRF